MTSNKNLIFGVLALVVICASVFIVTAKSSFKVQPKPQQKNKVKEVSNQSKKTKEQTKQEKATRPKKEVKNTYKPRPVPDKTHTALRAPTEPAPEPEQEDIFQITATGHTCQPEAINVGDKKSIILEVKAKHDSYNFSIVDLPIREVIEQGKTKRISFPRPSSFNKLEFKCIRTTK